MRARGFCPVQMWGPDMRSEALVREGAPAIGAGSGNGSAR
ncbi:antitoxin MazE-like protein [Corynebacterium hindlerae]|nr:antitoxin MazE-like protein [Corynebacterium hindlerae]